jgi:hypothetical protein
LLFCEKSRRIGRRFGLRLFLKDGVGCLVIRRTLFLQRPAIFIAMTDFAVMIAFRFRRGFAVAFSGVVGLIVVSFFLLFYFFSVFLYFHCWESSQESYDT